MIFLSTEFIRYNRQTKRLLSRLTCTMTGGPPM